jgi:succinylglutamate desuccinylase
VLTFSDCCDASDEYVSDAICINNCSELGKVARVEAQKLAKLMKLGYEMRVQLSKKGKELKQEKKVNSRWNVSSCDDVIYILTLFTIGG